MFIIHPSDLSNRRKRCANLREEIDRLDWEHVTQCNICGTHAGTVVANQDRYGFPLRTVICSHCGFAYLADRLTEAGYAHFYERWYRPLVSQFKGYAHTPDVIQRAQKGYAQAVSRGIRGYVDPAKVNSLLDIGGSTGLVAAAFARQLQCEATVLDPAPAEVAAAEKLGMRATVGTIEQWETEEQFDLVLLCQTIDHLYDLKAALRKVKQVMVPDGLFYCDIVDLLEVCQTEGAPEAVTKLDHCYYLTRRTAAEIFRAIGFEIISINIGIVANHVGFLMRHAEVAEPQIPSGAYNEHLVDELQKITVDWVKYGRQPLGPWDWARKRAYKLKKTVF